MENDNKKKTYPTQVVLTIRTIVGAYVLYTAYQIMTSGDEKAWYMYLFVALFIVAGIVLVVWSLKQLVKGEYEGGKADISQNTDETDKISDNNNAEYEAGESVQIEQITDAEIIEEPDMSYKAVDFSGVNVVETAKSRDVEQLD